MRRPCLIGIGIYLDKTLKRLDIGLIKFPIGGEVPKQYQLILIE